jgi:hypothetical protein
VKEVGSPQLTAALVAQDSSFNLAVFLAFLLVPRRGTTCIAVGGTHGTVDAQSAPTLKGSDLDPRPTRQILRDKCKDLSYNASLWNGGRLWPWFFSRVAGRPREKARKKRY